VVVFFKKIVINYLKIFLENFNFTQNITQKNSEYRQINITKNSDP
jgi:hypothetical protein